MKLLILSHTGPCSNFKIGSHHYANGLSKQGYSVTYMGINNTLVHRILKRYYIGEWKLNADVKIFNCMAIFPLTVNNKFFSYYLNSFFYYLSSVVKKNKFDVVICDTPFFYPMLRAIDYKKIIYRPTDDYYAMVGKKVLFHEQSILCLADKVICTSSEVRDSIAKRYNYPSKLMHVIHNGYDSKIFHAKQEFECRSNAVYIGALDYRFDFKALFKLANNNPTCRFDIFGPIKKYSNEFKQFKDMTNVTFHGAIEYEKTGELLNKYKVGLLLLNTHDANSGRSPMKLWEYYASGLNILYTGIEMRDVDARFYKYKSLDDIESKFHSAYNQENNHSDDLLINHEWSAKVGELIGYIS